MVLQYILHVILDILYIKMICILKTPNISRKLSAQFIMLTTLFVVSALFLFTHSFCRTFYDLVVMSLIVCIRNIQRKVSESWVVHQMIAVNANIVYLTQQVYQIHSNNNKAFLALNLTKEMIRANSFRWHDKLLYAPGILHQSIWQILAFIRHPVINCICRLRHFVPLNLLVFGLPPELFHFHQTTRSALRRGARDVVTGSQINAQL